MNMRGKSKVHLRKKSFKATAKKPQQDKEAQERRLEKALSRALFCLRLKLMKKESKRKMPSKKKACSEKNDKTPKKNDSKWHDFLRRHTKAEEKSKSNGGK